MNGGTRLRTRVAASFVATLAALSLGTAAHAGTGGSESISVSPSTVTAGGQVTITGAGWFCAADVDVFLDAQLITSVSWDDIDNGGFVVATAAPDGDGVYEVVAEYGFTQTSVSCEGRAADSFTVVPGATTVAPTTTQAPTTTEVTTSTTQAPTTTAGPTTTEAAAGGPTTTTDVENNAPTTTAAAGGGPVSTLPATGGSSASMTAYALIALALGGMLVVAARRRGTV